MNCIKSQSGRKHRAFLIAFLFVGGAMMLVLKFSFENYLDLSRPSEEYSSVENLTGAKATPKLTQENETFRRNFLMPIEGLTKPKPPGPAYYESEDTGIMPASARIKAVKIFHNKPLVVWTSDLHATPTKDLIELLTPFGVKFYHFNLDKSRCEWFSCQHPFELKVLTMEKAMNMSISIAEEFYRAYQNDPVMGSVDVVFCAHPASLCEIYLPFDKGMLITPSTRYEMFRFTVEKWNRTNQIFIEMAKKPWNVFGGNNLYDAKYLEYYTGIKTHHIPSICDYTSASYTQEIKTYLLLRRYDRGFTKYFRKNFTSACEEIKCTVEFDEIYRFSYHDLAMYKAVINVPYQISVMTIFELYRMNVPMFFPSPELLARWQADHYLMVDITHDGVFLGKRPNASNIPPHPSQSHVPDPKNQYDYESILYWVRMSDFYQVMPYCIIYDSIPQLVYLLETVTDEFLMDLSKKMEKYNVEFKKNLLNKWRDILLRFAENSPNRPY